MDYKTLNKQFFRSKNTVKIAKDLLGKFLIRRYSGKTQAYLITEVETYDGFQDKASHAYRGKTERNKVMFGQAGHWYIYFTYGIHWMLNIVTGPQNYPAAILIRSVIQLSNDRLITGYNGPAKLTKALRIDKKLNNKSANKKSGLWIAAPKKSERASPNYKNWARRLKIQSAPRIGIDYAGPVWSKKKLRFYFKS